MGIHSTTIWVYYIDYISKYAAQDTSVKMLHKT